MVSMLATVGWLVVGAVPHAAETAIIEGTVVDSNAVPIAGARIGIVPNVGPRVQFTSIPWPGEDAPRTDEKGRFRLAAPAARSVVLALREGVVQRVRAVPVEVSAGEKAHVRIVFETGVPLRGRVLDDKANPIAGVKVSAVPDPASNAQTGDATLGSAESAPDGSVEIPGMRTGAYRLFPSSRIWFTTAPRSVGFAARTDTPFVVVMVRKGRLHGRITGDGGKPLRRFYFETQERGGGWIESEDGTYEFAVLNGWRGLVVLVRAEGYAAVARRVDVNQGEDKQLDVALTRGRSVRGSVLSSDGKPVAGATVSVGYEGYAWAAPASANDAFPAGSTSAPVATTNERGVFTLPSIEDGPTSVRLSHPEHRRTETQIPAGAGDVDLRFSGAVGKVRVRIEDADGEPLAGYSGMVYGGPRCTSDAKGSCFLAGLDPRGSWFELMGPRAPGEPFLKPRALWVKPAASGVAEARLRVPRSPSVLRIVPVNPDGTFAHAVVFACPGAIPRGALHATRDTIDSDAPCHMTRLGDLMQAFPNLGPGRYTLVAFSPGLEPRCSVQEVDLASGAEVTVKMTIPERGCAALEAGAVPR